MSVSAASVSLSYTHTYLSLSLSLKTVQTCITHALTTEKEEVMGLLIGNWDEPQVSESIQSINQSVSQSVSQSTNQPAAYQIPPAFARLHLVSSPHFRTASQPQPPSGGYLCKLEVTNALTVSRYQLCSYPVLHRMLSASRRTQDVRRALLAGTTLTLTSPSCRLTLMSEHRASTKLCPLVSLGSFFHALTRMPVRQGG